MPFFPRLSRLSRPSVWQPLTLAAAALLAACQSPGPYGSAQSAQSTTTSTRSGVDVDATSARVRFMAREVGGTHLVPTGQSEGQGDALQLPSRGEFSAEWPKTRGVCSGSFQVLDMESATPTRVAIKLDSPAARCAPKCSYVFDFAGAKFEESCGAQTRAGRLQATAGLEHFARAAGLVGQRAQAELNQLLARANQATTPDEIDDIRRQARNRRADINQALDKQYTAFRVNEDKLIASLDVAGLRAFLAERRTSPRDPATPASAEGRAQANDKLEQGLMAQAQTGARPVLEALLTDPHANEPIKKVAIERLRPLYVAAGEAQGLFGLFQRSQNVDILNDVRTAAKTPKHFAWLEYGAVSLDADPHRLFATSTQSSAGTPQKNSTQNQGYFANFTSRVGVAVSTLATVALRPDASTPLRHNSYTADLEVTISGQLDSTLRSNVLGNKDTLEPFAEVKKVTVTLQPPHYKGEARVNFSPMVGYFQSGSHGGFTVKRLAADPTVSARIVHVAMAQLAVDTTSAVDPRRWAKVNFAGLSSGAGTTPSSATVAGIRSATNSLLGSDLERHTSEREAFLNRRSSASDSSSSSSSSASSSSSSSSNNKTAGSGSRAFVCEYKCTNAKFTGSDKTSMTLRVQANSQSAAEDETIRHGRATCYQQTQRVWDTGSQRCRAQ